MGISINQVLVDNRWTAKPLRIVEVVGPAGAGKSTLSRVLSQRDERILVCDPPFVWSVLNFPFFTWHILQLAPMLIRLSRNHGRKITRREIAWMATLNGWPQVLRRKASNKEKVIFLDQGPVFLLTLLYNFGPKSLQSSLAEKWWTAMYKQWAATLDMIIWVDTSDEILIDRIRSREQSHIMKDENTPQVVEFLAGYRAAYDQTIAKLTGQTNHLKLIRLDTGRDTVDGIVQRILQQLGANPVEVQG